MTNHRDQPWSSRRFSHPLPWFLSWLNSSNSLTWIVELLDHLGYFSWSAIIWGDLMQNAMPVGIWHAKPPTIQMDTNGASWDKKYNLIIYPREYTLFNRKSTYISEGFYIVYLSTKEFSANIKICFAVDLFLDPPKLPTSRESTGSTWHTTSHRLPSSLWLQIQQSH